MMITTVYKHKIPPPNGWKGPQVKNPAMASVLVYTVQPCLAQSITVNAWHTSSDKLACCCGMTNHKWPFCCRWWPFTATYFEEFVLNFTE